MVTIGKLNSILAVSEGLVNGLALVNLWCIYSDKELSGEYLALTAKGFYVCLD